MDSVDILLALIFAALGCATSVLLWSQLWFSHRKRDVLQRYEELHEGVACPARLVAQPIRRLVINCLPINTRHHVSFVYNAPNTGQEVSLTRRRIYNGCTSVQPFPDAFPVRVIEGSPKSGYPERWVQDRNAHFRPGILPLMVCLYGMTVFPGIVGQYPAGTIDTGAPLPYLYIIPVAILFLLVGFPLASWLFHRWEEDLTGEKKSSIGSSGSQHEYVGVEIAEGEGAESA